MIIHKLIAQHLKHRDDADFYSLQAEDAISWIARQGVAIGPKTTALDLGCGHGIFGDALKRMGCSVTFADESNYLMPSVKDAPYRKINLDRDDFSVLGRYDLVICSNVLEHLSRPKEFLANIHQILTPGGHFFLSWTNWLSPWGGHEFSPFHYLGPKLGVKAYDSLVKRKRIHTPFENLFPTNIGAMLKEVRRNKRVRLVAAAPRYYPEFSFILRLPVIREFLTWNCALLLQAQPADC
ncbi:MAG TPA: methyltransferase domain-containing protein [Verrucomicrobiae bacterium]|nr:methyltransferase domain-containing protein [Verrucomicrobiae bacterium]